MAPVTDSTTYKTITFAHPFSLEGVDGTYPPGSYEVTETREPVDGLSFLGYRRTKTTIELPGLLAAYASRQVVEIEPADLEAALKRDSEECMP
jgi:hypothetical protein